MNFPLEFRFKQQNKKSAKEEKLAWFKDKLCFSLHWLTIILAAPCAFLTGSPQTSTSTWNMTLYCNDQTFNQTLLSVQPKWPVLTMVIVSFVVVILLSIEMLVCGPSTKDFFNILNYFVGLVFGWYVNYALQSMLGYPIPSFFQNQQLRDHYCCKTCISKVTKQLLRIDMESRGSFPSFLICGSSYCTVFIFLLCYHIDEKQRFALKLVAFFLPGVVTFASSWYLWQNHENHLVDLVGGAVIGIIIAVIMANDLFLHENMMNNLTDNFLSAIMARQIQLVQPNEENTSNQDRNDSNRCVINLYPHEGNTQEEDLPPPYSSLT